MRPLVLFIISGQLPARETCSQLGLYSFTTICPYLPHQIVAHLLFLFHCTRHISLFSNEWFLGKKLISLVTADYLTVFFSCTFLRLALRDLPCIRWQRTRKNLHPNSNGLISKGFLAGSPIFLPTFACRWVSFLFGYTYVC